MAKKFECQEYSVATKGHGLEQTTKLKRVLANMIIGVSAFVIVISCAMIAFTIVFFLSPVSGSSMMTTLNANGNTDSALMTWVGAPTYEDIIITKMYVEENGENYTASRYPETDENGHFMYIIKRVIALGGDKLTMSRTLRPDATPKYNYTGDLYYDYADYYYYLVRNGEILAESYLDPKVAHRSANNFIKLWHALNRDPYADWSDWKAVPANKCLTYNPDYDATNNPNVSRYVLNIPEQYWFFMGDNRSNSMDGSVLGPQKMAYSAGRCVDIVKDENTVASYLWDKIVYYVFFGWLWQN